MKANGSKSIYVAFTTRKETCPPVHIKNVQFPQAEHVKYLGLHIDRRLTWQKHIFIKRKQGTTLTKMCWLFGRKSNLYKQQTSRIQNNTQTNLNLRNTTLGYGFYFQH
jgi:hypothetical protein